MSHRTELASLRAELDDGELAGMIGLAVDRPMIEQLLRKEARGQSIAALAGLDKRQLGEVVVRVASASRSAAKKLLSAIAEATAPQRQKLRSTPANEWPALIEQSFAQARGLAKFILALATIDDPAARDVLRQTVTLVREQAAERAQLLEKAAAVGVKDTVLQLERSVGEVSTHASSLEDRVIELQTDRARLIAEVGRVEAERRRLREEHDALQRARPSHNDARLQQVSEEREALLVRLRKLEKQASFVREREDDRVKLQRVSNERDHLLTEIAMLRSQLHATLVAAARMPIVVEVEAAKVIASPTAASKHRRKDDRDDEPHWTGVFIDGANLSASARRLFGKGLDFEALRALLCGRDPHVVAIAYVVDDGGEGFAPFAKRLTSAGYEIVKCRPKRFADGTVKADQDVALAVDALTRRQAWSRVVIGSGDGDFVPLIKALQKRGSVVDVAAFAARTAAEVRDAVDHFVALDESVTL